MDNIIGEVKTPPLQWDVRFMRLALEISTWSKDPECQVGAVIVSPDKRRFTAGYNGFPRGVVDTKERLKGSDRVPLTAHAELNALLNAKCDLDGWTLFVTRCPCLECAKAIAQAGVSRVVSPPPDPQSSWYDNCRKAVALIREAGVVFDNAYVKVGEV